MVSQDAASCLQVLHCDSTITTQQFKTEEKQGTQQRNTGIQLILHNFKERHWSQLNIRETIALGSLKAQVNTNRVLVAGCLYSEESLYDDFEDEFAAILPICADIVAYEDVARCSAPFLLDEGVLYPLQVVAIHCRNGKIRHQAFEQLKKQLDHDDSWRTEALTSMVQTCIEVEESFLAARPESIYSPEWHRVHGSGFNLLENILLCKAKIHFTIRPNGFDGDWYHIQRIVSC